MVRGCECSRFSIYTQFVAIGIHLYIPPPNTHQRNTLTPISNKNDYANTTTTTTSTTVITFYSNVMLFRWFFLVSMVLLLMDCVFGEANPISLPPHALAEWAHLPHSFSTNGDTIVCAHRFGSSQIRTNQPIFVFTEFEPLIGFLSDSIHVLFEHELFDEISSLCCFFLTRSFVETITRY